MNFTDRTREIHEAQRVVLIVSIQSDPIPWDYTSTGRRWVPTQATGSYSRDRRNGGPWSEWKMDGVFATGYSVKVDGSAGATRREWVYDGEIYGYLKAQCPVGDLPEPLELQTGL